MRFIRPEYIFRPAQILRRLAWGLGMTKKAGSAMAPWGLTLRFDPDEVHGRAMLALGLSDLRVNEMIARIVRKGDIAVDIGANIGIMASLMAARSGPSGFVYAFEPHPKIRETLQKNIAAWASAPVPTAPVSVIPMAVSYPYAGGGILFEPHDFSSNSGLARLKTNADRETLSDNEMRVRTIDFDSWASKINGIRLVKIDVEGHEDQVIAGMTHALAASKIDYLIFEEMRKTPSPATRALARYGYDCYLIDRSLWGPILYDVNGKPNTLVGEATNILACAKDRDTNFLRGPGWFCLKQAD